VTQTNPCPAGDAWCKNAAATIGVIGLRYGTLNAGAAFRPPAPRRRSEKLPEPKVR
jgi:hypothetical protein